MGVGVGGTGVGVGVGVGGGGVGVAVEAASMVTDLLPVWTNWIVPESTSVK